VTDKPVFVGELLEGHARDLFDPEAQPVALAGGQPREAKDAPRRSVVGVARDADGWRVKQVLAERGTPLEKMYRVAVAHGLDPVFPPAVVAEVDALVKDAGIDDPDLEDLTDLPFVTIDGPGTRDLDQAVFVARDGDGWLVHYALADPAWCVRPGTALFDEALRRGASYYLPGLAIPMLPRALSEGIVSLNAGHDRRSMIFRMHVDAHGHCTKTTIARARVRSRAQLTFQQVQDYLDRDAATSAPDAHPSLSLLREVGRARLSDAEERNVVHYRRSETEVRLDPQPPMSFVVELSMRTEVERYNEQISLMCNVEGARLLLKAGESALLQPVFRVHPRPAPEKLVEFEQILSALVKRHALDDAWRWTTKDNLADYLSSLPQRGPHAGVARAIHRQAVLTNVRSTFSQSPARHHGIGADVYARFSAPMREIVGVFVHKECFEQLGQQAPSAGDADLRERVVERANEAKALQKLITKEANLLVLDELFESDRRTARNKRAWRSGTVLGMTRGKAHVMLDDPAIEVKVYSQHLERLLDTRIDLSSDGVQLERSDGSVVCCIGDTVRIRVHERDGQKRWIIDLERANA
jgi:ribonuclease R